MNTKISKTEDFHHSENIYGAIIIVDTLEKGSILRLRNNINEYNLTSYREAFEQEIANYRKDYDYELPKTIYADFSEIKSLNSFGILVIIQAHKLAALHGVEFIICKASQLINEIFNSTGFKLNFSNQFNLG